MPAPLESTALDTDPAHRAAAGPLRVGIDYRPALLSRSGIARSVRELARALDARCAAQSLGAAGDPALGDRRAASKRPIEVHRFGHSLARCRVPKDPTDHGRLHRWPIPGRALPLLGRLGVSVERLSGRCEVFHWTDFVYPPLSRRRTRAVVTIHDMSFFEDDSFHGTTQSRILAERCAAAAERACHVITPTDATAKVVREHLGIAAADISTIPFGADHLIRGNTADAVPPHPRGGRSFLLSIGTVEPRKNHARLLAAWRGLPTGTRPDWVLIGRAGWEHPDVLNALRDADRDEAGFSWIEDADDRSVRQHLAHATAFAYPSRLEGFGFPILEACAQGLPTLAGDTPALREVGGDAVAYCDPESTDSVRDQLQRVLVDPELRSALRLAGLARAAEFQWSRCADAHAQVYLEAAR